MLLEQGDRQVVRRPHWVGESGTVLEVASLRKAYDSVVALDGVDLSVDRGQVVGLLGPNGAGKTTLVSIISGLRKADSGSVTVNGIDALAHPHKARAHLGLAPQEMGIYPSVSVRNNLQLFAELAGIFGRTVTTQIEQIAVALRLDGLLDRKAGEMSGGQKRRLHTAIALLNDPLLVMLDEPTTGADVETRAALLEVVGDLARKGSSVLYSTHYLQEFETLDATVVIMEQGRIITSGTVSDLVAAHADNVVVMDFAGEPPRLPNGFDITINGSVMRVSTDDPGRAIADVLGQLGADSSKVRGIEIIRPSLETAYLAITGSRLLGEGAPDVVAA